MSNSDIAQGRWHQLKGRIKQEWSELSDDELGQIEGRMDRLVGVLEEKFGIARNAAEKKIRQLEADVEIH